MNLKSGNHFQILKKERHIVKNWNGEEQNRLAKGKDFNECWKSKDLKYKKKLFLTA